jgi:PAS domain S-box-containing protein
MLHDMLDQAAYMAHGYCLLWKPWLIAMHAGSDLVISLSYLAIPAAIWVFVRKRQDLSLKPLAILFASFIFLCGLTHSVEAVTLWWPVYETQAFLKLATAAASAATALVIFPLIPKALAIPSPTQLSFANEGLAAEIAAHRTTLAELERTKGELERRVAERTKELEHAKARFQALVNASAQVVWTCNPKGEVFEDSPSWRLFTGQSVYEFSSGNWINAIHPDDRDRALTAWRQALQSRRIYSAEYRLRHIKRGYRWTEAKGVPLLGADGEVREWVGMNTDIDERRRSEDHVQFVMKELSHRTKNLLAVIYSMARQIAKRSQPQDFIADFGARIQALAKSHDLLVSTNWKGVPLEEHIRAQLQPFAPLDNRQLRISGPPLVLGPAATQALGLAFHELATNAAKYGALTGAGGSIEIAWSVESRDNGQIFRLAWRESKDGFELPAEKKLGFGHIVLTRVVPDTLLGTVDYSLTGCGVSWEIEAAGDQVIQPAPPQDTP